MSCSSSEETFFAFELPPYQPADVQLTPNDEPGDETALSEECTGLLLDDGAESTQAGDHGKDHNGVVPSGSGTFFGAEESDMLRMALEREAELLLEHNYLRFHDETQQPNDYINADMRRLTVGWMGEVVREFGLSQETLFGACRLLDRFLSCSRKVPRICLQLVAAACVQIAAKNEEVLYPSVKSFTYIAGNAFSCEDLVKTERLVLRCVSWRIQLPTSYTFLSIFKHALGLEPRTVALACYLLELGQVEYSLLAYRPSQMAAAASLLAMSHFNQPSDVGALAHASCSSVFELKGCLELLLLLQRSALQADHPNPLAAVREEYRSPKWLGAACVTPFDSLPFPMRALPLGSTC